MNRTFCFIFFPGFLFLLQEKKWIKLATSGLSAIAAHREGNITSTQNHLEVVLQIYESIKVTRLEVDAHAHALLCQRHLVLVQKDCAWQFAGQSVGQKLHSILFRQHQPQQHHQRRRGGQRSDKWIQFWSRSKPRSHEESVNLAWLADLTIEILGRREESVTAQRRVQRAAEKCDHCDAARNSKTPPLNGSSRAKRIKKLSRLADLHLNLLALVLGAVLRTIESVWCR